jgi:hypothetical protein
LTTCRVTDAGEILGDEHEKLVYLDKMNEEKTVTMFFELAKKYREEDFVKNVHLRYDELAESDKKVKDALAAKGKKTFGDLTPSNKLNVAS